MERSETMEGELQIVKLKGIINILKRKYPRDLVMRVLMETIIEIFPELDELHFEKRDGKR